MRTHSKIIKDAGGPQGVIDKLGAALSIHTVRSWQARDAIPSEWWKPCEAAGIASLDEIATAHTAKKGVAASEAA